MQTINPKQLRRLQTLYGQLAAHAQQGVDRTARLNWASEHAGRKIGSFKDLTFEEGKRLIDGLQGQLGLHAPRRRPMRRDQARRAGLDGRHDGQEFAKAPQMVTPADLATIESYYNRLGWTRAQFDAWLHSSRSPLRNRTEPKIDTLAKANQVRWALKGMLVQRGLWRDQP
jgi:hypothetical protein